MEKKKFCCCCTVKCGVIFIGVLMLVEFLYEVFEVWSIFVNDYFDVYYGVVYTIILLGLAAACIL